jgi:hypothetical protein
MNETAYAATINTPGYLPETEPAYFATAAEAWTYLAEEREEALSALTDAQHDETTRALREAATAVRLRAHLPGPIGEGTLTGTTPGYTGDHDLGQAYAVAAVHGQVCPTCGDLLPSLAALDAHGMDSHLEHDTL